MRKLFFYILLGAAFVAPNKAAAKVNIFACEPEWAYLANQIGGDNVEAISATTPKQNPHYIAAKPSLLAKMRKADIVFCSGSGLEEGWLPVLLKAAGGKQVQDGNIGYFMATDYVQMLEVINNPNLIDRSMGDIHPEGNPHIHLDPKRYLKVAKAFTKTLSKIDSNNASTYQANLNSFTKIWQANIAKWQAMASSLKGKKFISYHKNFTYLADWLDLNIVATLEPKPGISPSIEHLSGLVKNYKNVNIHKIISTQYEDQKGANWLSKKIGVKAVQLPYSSKNDAAAVFDNIIKQLK